MAPAKLLLFGEHTVLHGGEALALPLRRFSARWSTFANVGQAELFQDWAAFAKTRFDLVEALDIDRWFDESSELSVESDIPMAYGLGSSGALTALVFARYRRGDLPDLSLTALRALLGQLESYFHGRSSGLDPLVSYLDAGVYIDARGEATRVAAHMPTFFASGGWFLYDSGRPKAGERAIAGFGESCKDEAYRQNFLHPASTLVSRLIACCALDTQLEALAAGWHDYQTLSRLQLQHLPFLIPDDVAQQWEHWAADGSAFLKLCGAGGGGFFLGYAPERMRLEGAAGVFWV